MSSIFDRQPATNMSSFSMKSPYLIQRGIFKKIVAEITGIDSIIEMDYMGSSEFEYGALPLSLREICQNINTFQAYSLEAIQNKAGESLYFFCHSEFQDQVAEYIIGLQQKKFDLKEGSYFPEHIAGKDRYYLRINFWWDIRNHFMFCFGKEKVQRLQEGLTALRSRWITEGKVKEIV